MKKMFTIFPALFVLTPGKTNEPEFSTLSNKEAKRINYDSNDNSLFNGRHQVYKGNCRVNADRSMISICFSSTAISSSFHMHLHEVFNASLHPVIISGKKYTITYLPVSN